MIPKPTIPNAESMMNRRVYCVTPEMSLAEVVQVFLKHDVSCAPVVDKDGVEFRSLLGFVSEADCLEYLSNEMFYGGSSQPQTAATIMKKHPICVGPQTDVFALTSIFVSHEKRHVPVVDAEHHLLGLISRREILRSLETFYRENNQEYLLEHFPPDLQKISNLRFVARSG